MSGVLHPAEFPVITQSLPVYLAFHLTLIGFPFAIPLTHWLIDVLGSCRRLATRALARPATATAANHGANVAATGAFTITADADA
jgi:hypothetical protein